jgi:hypothetical protein
VVVVVAKSVMLKVVRVKFAPYAATTLFATVVSGEAPTDSAGIGSKAATHVVCRATKVASAIAPETTTGETSAMATTPEASSAVATATTHTATAKTTATPSATPSSAPTASTSQRITGDGRASDGQSSDEGHDLMQSELLLHHDYLSVRYDGHHTTTRTQEMRSYRSKDRSVA